MSKFKKKVDFSIPFRMIVHGAGVQVAILRVPKLIVHGAGVQVAILLVPKLFEFIKNSFYKESFTTSVILSV